MDELTLALAIIVVHPLHSVWVALNRAVCGRALGYHRGLNYGFYGYRSRPVDIEGLDGLSLTHGAPGSRQYIWTFASGLFTGNYSTGVSRFPEKVQWETSAEPPAPFRSITPLTVRQYS